MDGGSGAIDDKRMKLRFAGVCRLCGTDLPARAEAVYERATKTVRCVACPSDAVVFEGETEVEPGPTPVELDRSMKLERQVHRRAASTSAARPRTRNDSARWGSLGGIAVALSDEKQSTKAWATGAIGEERLGCPTRLAGLGLDRGPARPTHPRLESQHRPHRITSAGVWVIDAKRYKGRPEMKDRGRHPAAQGREGPRRSPRLHQARRWRPQAGRPRTRIRRRRVR